MLSPVRGNAWVMTRVALLSDEMWARVEPLLPPAKAAMGSPMRQHRDLVKGRSTATATPSLGEISQRSSARGRRSGSATTRSQPTTPWDKVPTVLQVQADAKGQIRLRAVGRLHERPSSPARRDGFQVSGWTHLAHRGVQPLGPATIYVRVVIRGVTTGT